MKFPQMLLSVLLLVLGLAVLLPAQTAMAQQAGGPGSAGGYGALGGGSSGGGAAPGSTPAPAGDGAAVLRAPLPPELEAYGRISGSDAGVMIDAASERVDVFRQRAERVLSAAPGAGSEILRAIRSSAPGGDPLFFVGLLVFIAILLVIGRAVSSLYAAYVARPIMVSVQRPAPEGIVEKLPVLALRVALTLLGLAIVLLVTLGLGVFFFDRQHVTLRTALVLLGSYAVMVSVDTTWRMIVSPYLPRYRIPRMSDAQAVRMYFWLSGTSAAVVVMIGIQLWLEMVGVSAEVLSLVRVGFGLISTLLLIVLLLTNRDAVTAAILAGRPRRDSGWLVVVASRLWAPVAVLYLAFSWVMASYREIMGLPGVPGIVSGFWIFLISLIVYAIIMFAVERVFIHTRRAAQLNRAAAEARRARAERETEALATAAWEGDESDMDGDGDEEGGGTVVSRPLSQETMPGFRHGMTTFEDLARRAASLLALGISAWLLVRLWVGTEVMEEGSFWNLAGDIVDTVFLGYIFFHAVRIWMDRKIRDEGVYDTPALEPGDEGGAGSAASRLGTLLPLVRSFVLICVFAAVALIVAAQLGVNVAPLFAGAGVVGLAIGFGSQTLVRDILSGMFFLLDDAFRKGEYIDVGEVKGTVEKISLRSFQLRHHLGALNTIPFGEIRHLTNYSRDWVMMKLPLRLTYDTDVDKLRKVIKKLGQELLEHPTEGHKFVQPLKSQGVYMMEDSAMIVRVKFMTRPGDQWTTRKLVYQRIREVFAENGIKFAHREVTVHIPDRVGDKTLTEEEKQAAAGAARRAIEGEEPSGGASLAEAR
ncbi:mechanosensitive ion channel family protein [Oceanicella sp. SM1341]|uniref:mechanosensitive ion channel family protein n=1 Tax=Oceanicella sp. SM1341 TaxID=1548889 RepID=UPI001E595F19|nr:mechanosensitive ion channel family protein [Oceanicella sp. SM1341]